MPARRIQAIMGVGTKGADMHTWLGTGAAALCALWLGGSSASAQQLIIAEAVVCDTQQAVEEFLALNDEGADLDATVNAKREDGSCIRGTFHLAPSAIVGTARNEEGLWSITRILVLARVEQQVTAQFFLTAPMPEIQVRYMAVRRSAQPA
jgi:hypothetical protein